jgi:XTP/dITP diphosphohydrolase
MKKLLIATANKHKIVELGRMLATLGYEVMGLEILPDYVSPKESGKTFIENARIKANALREHFLLARKGLTPPSILADDSGIACDDLNGAPGIYSARYARSGATDESNNRKLVRELLKKHDPKMGARYVCALVLLDPDGKEMVVEEKCEGKIVFEPKGSGGFGYDPHFFVEQYGRTMAELTPVEKDAISHRGKALRKLVETLKEKP